MLYNFEHFSLSVLKLNVGYLIWNAQNAYQNSKQGRLIRLLLKKQSDLSLPCLFRPFWQATAVQNFRPFTLSYDGVIRNRECYMSVQVLLNLLNKLRKRYKISGLPSITSLFHNKFHKFNNKVKHFILFFIFCLNGIGFPDSLKVGLLNFG